MGDLRLSSLTGFLLFIVLVWLSVALGKALAAVAPGQVTPNWARAIMDPNADAKSRQGHTVL